MNQKRNNINLEIIETLISKRLHIREISRRIQQPTTTVLRKVNYLLKNNVLRYSIEGRNKVFFLKKKFIN